MNRPAMTSRYHNHCHYHRDPGQPTTPASIIVRTIVQVRSRHRIPLGLFLPVASLRKPARSGPSSSFPTNNNRTASLQHFVAAAAPQCKRPFSLFTYPQPATDFIIYRKKNYRSSPSPPDPDPPFPGLVFIVNL